MIQSSKVTLQRAKVFLTLRILRCIIEKCWSPTFSFVIFALNISLKAVANQNIYHYKLVCPGQYHVAVDSSYHWNRKVRKSAPGSWEFQMKQEAVLHTIRLWLHRNIPRWCDYKERSHSDIEYNKTHFHVFACTERHSCLHMANILNGL